MTKSDSPTDWSQAAFAKPGQEPFTQVIIPGLMQPCQISPELSKAMQDYAKAAAKPNADGIITVDVPHDFLPTPALEVSCEDVKALVPSKA